MPYVLVYTKSSAKNIQKLDEVVKKQIGRKLDSYSKNSLKRARKMIDSKAGTYRWRFGNYRVIFDIVGKDIVILKVSHRKDIYNNP